MVWKGRRYPMNRDSKISIDTSLFPSDTQVDLPRPSDVRGWQWVPKESIVWQGHATDGICDVCDREGRFILVRDDGYMVTNRTFSLAGDFSEQSAPVYINGRGATFITDFGDLLNNRWFDRVSGYHEGLAAVCENGRFGYIDVDGVPVFGRTFDYAGDFRNGEAFAVSDGRPCTVSLSGKVSEI
jgi:hypothetical protein